MPAPGTPVPGIVGGTGLGLAWPTLEPCTPGGAVGRPGIPGTPPAPGIVGGAPGIPGIFPAPGAGLILGATGTGGFGTGAGG
ncbi:hypothetical protein AG1IA_08537 [Rhizoctonia solani AG-1 IA]|uniref:Uncharacterized protein n=1 Tax=Thanatephorus cucumeris (strain AG1-IA) TaxID=983506 RepID=L8WL19_THACA|nr:hypothetical protein AG1IA_08537 [Rhizoctonia solani AG-1 IA]